MKRVLLGMSGGVDSAAAAVFLRRQGYEVEGATLLLEGNADGAGDAAQLLAHHLGQARACLRLQALHAQDQRPGV